MLIFKPFNNGGFGFMFNFFPIMFMLIFCTVIGIILFTIVRGVSQWNKNNNSPVLTVDAAVVTKREDVSEHMHDVGNGAMHNDSVTYYYVTFQVQSGDRMELHVSGSDYGMLAEGDKGRLTFQGTRYLGFERTI